MAPRSPALLLLGVLAFATVNTGVAAGCGSSEWTCANEKCISARNRCDGVPDCSDGSDEVDAMCDKASSIRMRAGQVIKVTADYKEEHQAIDIHMCGQTSCSSIVLHGLEGDKLAYYAASKCNRRGFRCSLSKYNYGGSFHPGPIVFNVKLLPGKLAVWLDGREDSTVTVPVEEDSDLLRVRPWYWTSDLHVEFVGIAGCSKGMWQCGNRDCIWAHYRCDGVPECSDGSDEEAAMCDKAPSIRVQVGQGKTVRAEYKLEHAAVLFHLCSASSCSQLWVAGCTADGALWYRAQTGCNARAGNCSLESKSPGFPAGGKDFPAGPLVFKAERRLRELAVWLDGHEDKAATVPVQEGSDLLRVRPYSWTNDLAVQFTDGATEEAGETNSKLSLGYKTYYVHRSKVNWHAALQICHSKNMSLAAITSPLEQDMLANFITNIGLAERDLCFWISGTDLAAEGQFSWVQDGQPMTYTNWNENEPNNGSGGIEHCVELLNFEYNFKWNDARCSYQQNFICEESPKKC